MNNSKGIRDEQAVRRRQTGHETKTRQETERYTVMTNVIDELTTAAVRDLRLNGLDGKIAVPGDAAYDRARQIWNGAVDSCPALFALCATREDVQIAVRVARKRGLRLSVRGGGHDFAGRAIRHNGLAIDLSRMRQVDVDPKAEVATIGGGATSMDVAEAAGQHGLVGVTGNVGAVGMGGFTLGGGYSPVTAKYGLALDNLLGAEVVLPDGRLVIADASQNPDLFWSLRGGGGNFGVVTSMRIRLHAIPSVLAGVIVFPWSEAESMLNGFAEFARSAPEELGVTTCLIPAPDGSPSVMLAANWCGGLEQGEAAMASLERLGTPLFAQVAPMTYAEMLHRFDDHVVNGRHYAVQTRWLPNLTPEILTKCTAAMDQRTSPFSAIIWHHFRGAATRVPPESTAFGLRKEHFMMEIVAAWEPSSRRDGEGHRQWARSLSQSLAPFSLLGGYPNMLSPEDLDQIPFAYGDNNTRLQSLKKRFDPNGIFTSAVPLSIGALA